MSHLRPADPWDAFDGPVVAQPEAYRETGSVATAAERAGISKTVGYELVKELQRSVQPPAL